MASQFIIWMVFTAVQCILYASVQAVHLTNVTQKHIPVEVLCKNNPGILCAMMYKYGACCTSFRVGGFTITLSHTGRDNTSSRFQHGAIVPDTVKTIGVQDQACHDIYLRNQNSVSGEYNLTTNLGAAMTVWCNFRNDVITTYLSKSTIAGLTTEELSLHYNIKTVVDVVAKWKVGKQTVSTLEQLRKFSNIPFRIMANEYTNYTQPINIHFKPFIYLGFLPPKMIHVNFIHGYRANGHDYTFRNCDGNPNNYFSFFVNANSQAPKRYSPKWNTYMRKWIAKAQNLGSRDYLPDKYFYESEIHFGGCGGFAITYDSPSVEGLSLGLRHTLN